MTDTAETPVPTVRNQDSPTIPTFATEREAQAFWAEHDSAPYFDQMTDVTEAPPPDLRPGPERARSGRRRPPPGRMDLVSLRLPADLIEGVKEVAAARHLPYQTLIRSWIAERLAAEQVPGVR